MLNSATRASKLAHAEATSRARSGAFTMKGRHCYFLMSTPISTSEISGRPVTTGACNEA